MSRTVHVPSRDAGQFSAYLALPPAGQGPGLVLLQYIFGVNQVMRDLADHYASLGYVVLVPDLFWRQQPDVRMADDPAQTTPQEFQSALALEQDYDDQAGLRDLADALAYLRALPQCTGKAGALGFCLGGRLAYLMACHTDVDCAVGYYGVHLEDYLDDAKGIRAPVLMHMAGQDFLVGPELRERIMGALADQPLVQFQVYPQANHAFALPRGQHFHADSAALANQRSEQFLQTHLQPGL